MKSLKFWKCPSCSTPYLEKPGKCENEGRCFWSGYPTGCGTEGPIEEISIDGIVSVKTHFWTELQMEFDLESGKKAYVGFRGDTASERFDQFCKALGVENPLLRGKA